MKHTIAVVWTVELGDEFEPEFNEVHEDVRIEILALARPSVMSNWSRRTKFGRERLQFLSKRVEMLGRKGPSARRAREHSSAPASAL